MLPAEVQLSALAAIVTELNAPGEVGSAAEVVIGAGLFERNQKLNAAVFGAIESVPCLPAPDSLANPVRRAKSLAKLLTDDSREPALLPAAGSELTTRLNNRFAGLSVEHAAAVARNVEDIETMQGRHTVYGLDDADTKGQRRAPLPPQPPSIERDTRRIVASVKERAAKDYLKHVVETAGAGVDILGERTKVAALVRVPGVVSSIEATADEWVKEQLGWFRVQIKHTTGARKEAFLRVQGQTSTPEPSTSSCRRPSVRQPEHPTPKAPRRYQPFPRSISSPTTTATSQPSSTRGRPLLSKQNSPGPSSSHGTETHLAQPWPPTESATRRETGNGHLCRSTSSSSRSTPRAASAWSLIDPHGAYLGDAVPKLRGLARFARTFGDQFVRIESIAEVDGVLRVLDLQRTTTSAAPSRHLSTPGRCRCMRASWRRTSGDHRWRCATCSRTSLVRT